MKICFWWGCLSCQYNIFVCYSHVSIRGVIHTASNFHVAMFVPLLLGHSYESPVILDAVKSHDVNTNSLFYEVSICTYIDKESFTSCHDCVVVLTTE
jgi:hypothetical protein